MSSEPKPHPLSIFLVEDETLIRMMVAEMIEELGHTVVAEGSNLKQALSLAQTANFDVAILDINLSGAAN
jgi:CheY-like chemotaxis protein